MRRPALYLIQFPTWMDVLLLRFLAWHKEERKWMPPQGKQDSLRWNRRQVTENMSHSLKPTPHLHSVCSGSFLFIYLFFQNIQGKSFSLWTFVANFLWLSKSNSKVFVMWSNSCLQVSEWTSPSLQPETGQLSLKSDSECCTATSQME